MTQFEGEVIVQQVMPDIILSAPSAPEIVLLSAAQGPPGQTGSQGVQGPPGSIPNVISGGFF